MQLTMSEITTPNTSSTQNAVEIFILMDMLAFLVLFKPLSITG